MSNISVTSTAEGIYQLQIDDRENGNRLSPELCAEFLTALASLRGEPSLKVLILTGGKEVFCAGASLEMLKQISTGSADVKDFLLPDKILSFPMPVIGALESHAVGGGLTLALCCDILVASESSRYGVNFTNMGFTPGMGTTSLLPVVAGHHFASEMILTGKLYKGRELRERGLFNYVVPGEEVMEVALDIARRIAEKPRYILEMLKNTLALPRLQALQEAMLREHLMHKVCFSRPDTAEYIEAAYLA